MTLPWQPISEYPWPTEEYEIYGPEVIVCWPYKNGGWGFGRGTGFQYLDADEPPERTFTSGDFNVEPTHFLFFTPPEQKEESGAQRS